MIIRDAIPTNINIAKSGATNVGLFMTVHWNHFVGALDIEYGSAHSIGKHSLSSSFPGDPSFETPFNCLDFCNFSWLPL
jgi:hypothetical protein